MIKKVRKMRIIFFYNGSIFDVFFNIYAYLTERTYKIKNFTPFKQTRKGQ